MAKDTRTPGGVEAGLQYGLPDGMTGASLRLLVADECVLKREEMVETAVTVYETFDWRLFNQSLTLCQFGDELLLRELPTGRELGRVITPSAPAFGRDIAQGSLQQRVAAIVGMRRLLAVGNAIVQIGPYCVANADGKTVARLLDTKVYAGPLDGREQVSGASSALLDAYVVLQAVRGYPGHFRRLRKKLTNAGLTRVNWQATAERILAASDRRPGDYVARPDYQITPGTRADEAAKEVLRCTLTVMRANEAGIIADLDTEFLHDYRTAVRRTRSALSLIPNVFPPEVTAHYRDAFAQLGQRTNRLRDLDVNPAGGARLSGNATGYHAQPHRSSVRSSTYATQSSFAGSRGQSEVHAIRFDDRRLDSFSERARSR